MTIPLAEKGAVMKRHPYRAGAAAAAVAAVACIGAAGVARAEEPAACASSDASPYTMHLRALTGPAGADLTVGVDTDAASSCAAPQVLKKIQLKTFAADGTVASVENLKDVAAPAGVADVDLGAVPRDRRVEADVLVQTGTPSRTYVLRGATTTLLRPDLVVERIEAPPQALVSQPVDVTAVVRERNGDVGASADVTLSAVPGASVHVDVPAGGTVTVPFHGLSFAQPVPVELTVGIVGAAPAETDASNNTLAATIDVTAHALPKPYDVLVPSLGGYGAQFGMHLYAPITPWPAGLGYGDVEDKVKALEPQLVRIFYNDNWDGNANGAFPDWQTNYDSFVKVVQLAQDAGATIDIGFQNLANVNKPGANVDAAIAKFADVLQDLVVNHGLTNVRWAEIGNEPNGGATTLDQYNRYVRLLDADLRARDLRSQIHLMGGGLVEGTAPADHYTWMKWIGANMNDVVDAYAEHVYWWYDRPGRLEYRLRDSMHLLESVLPPDERKPVYMMEFGIRGYDTCGTKPYLKGYNHYYRDADCTDIWRTNIAAFQQLWFNIAAAQLGVTGTSKWDAFWAKYDKTQNNQFYWMIAPPTEGSFLTPTYNAMSLLFHTTDPGWRILRVQPWAADDEDAAWQTPGAETSADQPEEELAAYAGPDGQLTVVGLDTHGRDLNTVSTEPASAYSIGGLPPNTSFHLALWNATGDGTDSVGEVTTNGAGVARFDVPLQAAFALTTVPVS